MRDDRKEKRRLNCGDERKRAVQAVARRCYGQASLPPVYAVPVRALRPLVLLSTP